MGYFDRAGVGTKKVRVGVLQCGIWATMPNTENMVGLGDFHRKQVMVGLGYSNRQKDNTWHSKRMEKGEHEVLSKKRERHMENKKAECGVWGSFTETEQDTARKKNGVGVLSWRRRDIRENRVGLGWGTFSHREDMKQEGMKENSKKGVCPASPH